MDPQLWTNKIKLLLLNNNNFKNHKQNSRKQQMKKKDTLKLAISLAFFNQPCYPLWGEKSCSNYQASVPNLRQSFLTEGILTESIFVSSSSLYTVPKIEISILQYRINKRMCRWFD